jgi:hypothetical protein
MRLILGARVGTSTWRGLKKGGGETGGDFWGEREQRRSNELSTVRSCGSFERRQGSAGSVDGMLWEVGEPTTSAQNLATS